MRWAATFILALSVGCSAETATPAESTTVPIVLGPPASVGACTPNRLRRGTPDPRCESISDGRCTDPGTTNIAPGPLGFGITVFQPPSPPGDVCAGINVTGDTEPPSAVFLVDKSGSMDTRFGPTTRWEALYSALFDPTFGVITLAQSRVNFGMAFFSDECDAVGFVAPALNNRAALRTAFRRYSPGGNTGTAAALNALRARLPPGTIVILATDGEPNVCGGVAGTEAAALASHREGNDVYALSVGLDTSATHLDTVVRNGTGNPFARHVRANDPAALVAALDLLIGHAVVGCDVLLSAPIADPAYCDMAIDGYAILRDDPNGWTFRGGRNLTVQGTACASLQAGGDLRGQCRCLDPPPPPAPGTWQTIIDGECAPFTIANWETIRFGWRVYDLALALQPGGGGARVRVSFRIATTMAGLATAMVHTQTFTTPSDDVSIAIPPLTDTNARVGRYMQVTIELLPSGFNRPVLTHLSGLYECRPYD